MNDNKRLLASGWGTVLRNKRYIVWFWLLNLLLARFGAGGFAKRAGAMLDHSLYADRLTHGFDVGVFGELLFHPDFGRLNSMTTPALCFAVIFFLATAVFLPGIFAGYASTYRLPREDFFRACGRNLWRFIRIMIVAGIVMLIVGGTLFGINYVIGDKAEASTNERLSLELQTAWLAFTFLVMTTLRIWFDLAEADTVLNDQRAVRKSIAAAFRHTFRSVGRLLASYVAAAAMAAAVLVGGIWVWMKLVAPDNTVGAFLLAQLILLFLLIPRFWQRAMAVAYWQQQMLIPVAAPVSFEATPAAVPIMPVPVESSSDLP